MQQNASYLEILRNLSGWEGGEDSWRKGMYNGESEGIVSHSGRGWQGKRSRRVVG